MPVPGCEPYCQQEDPYKVLELAIIVNETEQRVDFDAVQLGGVTCGGGTPKPHLMQVPLKELPHEAIRKLKEQLCQALKDLDRLYPEAKEQGDRP